MKDSIDVSVNPFLAERIAYLEQNISDMRQFLKSAPAGNLVCRAAKNDTFRYYRNINEKQTYISMSENEDAKLLAFKKMYGKALASAEKELKVLLKLSDQYGLFERDIADFFINNPGCDKLINDNRHQENTELAEKVRIWQSEAYRKNPLYPEYLMHDTLKGEKVRSKSEASIADVLYLCRIPYRYECELIIGNEIFYPDFMIMDPETGIIFIWEHFGLIEMERYLNRTANKMKTYTGAGFFPNKNFIITSEDSDHPFTGSQAAEIVSKYFHRTII